LLSPNTIVISMNEKEEQGHTTSSCNQPNKTWWVGGVQLTPSNCRPSSLCRGITVTSSISHKNATSEGVNPGGKGNAMIRIVSKVKRSKNARVEVDPRSAFLTCGGCGLQIGFRLNGERGIRLAIGHSVNYSIVRCLPLRIFSSYFEFPMACPR
jgi:hypothetical protein